MKDALGVDLLAQAMAAVRARKQAKPLRCSYCGNDMTGYGQRRYCSAACRAKAHRQRHRDDSLSPPASEAP